MLNVYEVLKLERRWEAYKKQKTPNNKKNYILFGVVGFFAFLLLILIAYWIFSPAKITNEELQKTIQDNKSKFVNPAQNNGNLEQKNEIKKMSDTINRLKVELEKEKIKARKYQDDINQEKKVDEIYKTNKQDGVIAPNMFLSPKNIEINTNLNVSSEIEMPNTKKTIKKPAEDININIDLSKQTSLNTQETIEKKEKKEQIDKTIEIQPNSTNSVIEFTQNNFNIEDTIKQFSEKPSLNLALKISKYFYKEKDYLKSRLWALKANSLNKDNDESWIIFAKSSYKLGKKDEAIKALKDYLSFSDSQNAKNTLKLIEQGGL